MPDSATLGVFIAASLILLVTPGPAVLYIVARSIDQGWIAGVVSSLGMALGSSVHVTVAWLGMSAILFSSQTAFEALTYAGGAYLVYLGVQALRTDDHAAEGARMERQPLRRVFSQAIVVNLLNPKSALFFVAFLPQFVDVGRGTVAGQLLLFAAVFFALALITDTGYALLAGKLGDLLRGSSTFRRRQRYVSAAMYIGLGLTAVLSGAFVKAEKPPAEVTEFTVMAWNIWHGGHDEQLKEDGRPHVVDIIRASGADIVLMVETYGSGRMVAEQLGFNYHLIAAPGTAPDDPDVNLSIHSRYIWSHLDWTEEARRKNGGLVVPWWTTSAIAARGLVDTFRLINPSPVTHPGITWDSPGKRDEHRIDYIYFAGDKILPVASVARKVPFNEPITVGGKTSMYPSDHGFVLTTFRWQPQR